MTVNPSVFGRLEALFKLLDAAQLVPATILTSENHKQHYESLLMFAFSKLKAAQYHAEQVTKLVESHRVTLTDDDEEKIETKLRITEMSITSSRSADEFGFELSAFFAAIRSGIDFLVRAGTEHSKATKAESVQTLLKLGKSGKTSPILQVVEAHRSWLEHLRSYRDQVVHYLVLNTVSGGQKTWRGGTWVVAQYPIVVPSETPKVIHVTRLSRAMDEPKSRFLTSTTEGWFTDEQGNKKVLHHNVEFQPAPGYLRIEELMQRELTAFESFFSDLLTTLAELNFAPAPII